MTKQPSLTLGPFLSFGNVSIHASCMTETRSNRKANSGHLNGNGTSHLNKNAKSFSDEKNDKIRQTH